MITITQAERYREIIEEIKELIDEAKRITRQAKHITNERARSYCHAHIECALDSNHGYLGGSMYTMSDIADELESQANEEKRNSEENTDDE